MFTSSLSSQPTRRRAPRSRAYYQELLSKAGQATVGTTEQLGKRVAELKRAGVIKRTLPPPPASQPDDLEPVGSAEGTGELAPGMDGLFVGLFVILGCVLAFSVFILIFIVLLTCFVSFRCCSPR